MAARDGAADLRLVHCLRRGEAAKVVQIVNRESNDTQRDKAAPNPMNQEQIAAMVQQLYKLASELKEEVEHTNLAAVFPVTFVKKAQEAEKLAKQIKDRAKG